MKMRALFMCVIIVLSNMPANSEVLFDSKIILSGGWGVDNGHFGIEKEGKTELGYALDFIVAKEEIIILDSINDRMQHFDLKGKYISQTKLNKKWRENGLPWGFAFSNNEYYLLIGKAPYYSPIGISVISLFDSHGKFNKVFGDKYISKAKEEFYNAIYSDNVNKNVYFGIGGTSILNYNVQKDKIAPLISSKSKETVRLAGVTADGNPIVNVSKSGSKKTLIINPEDGKYVSDIKGRFNLVDNKGRFIGVHTSRDSNNDLVTNLAIYNSMENKSDKIVFRGDIRVTADSKIKNYKYSGVFFEKSKMDENGNIYHLIALEDGVVLRKVTLK